MTEVAFTANPTQKGFIESRAEADLFSSRKGEGKSAALCWANFYHVKHNPGAPWAIIRDTWENLQRTTLAEFFSWFPPQAGWGEWNKGDRCFTWAPEMMGRAPVYFLGMDERADASKVASMPLAGFGIDEPCPAAAEGGGVDEFIFTTAMGQLRWKGARWYAAKLAQNNSDELHWTYKRFIDPGTPANPETELPTLQQPGFRLWQPPAPENLANLPPGYYDRLRREFEEMGRPDLARRFVEGKVTNQLIGKQMTPEWDDAVHLAPLGLQPVRDTQLTLCWDWGLTPACIITQVTPSGSWLFLDALVGDGIGAYQLIKDQVKPLLRDRYRRFTWQHTGDPSGANRDQSDSDSSPVRVLRDELGGSWRPGPKDPLDGLPSLKACLSTLGRIRVDKRRAAPIWHAFRGGWHRNISRTGVVGEPVKDMHCVPLDTEILTPNGFLSCFDLAVGDACYGWRDGLLVDDEILELNRQDGQIEFLAFKGQAIDAGFTSEHRCLVTKRHCSHGGKNAFIEGPHAEIASNINTAHRFVTCAPWKGRIAKDREVSDSFVRLSAWVMTEGYYRKSGQIWIGQKTYADDVVRLALEFPGTVVRKAANGSMLACLRWETAFLLRLLLPYKAPSPAFCRMMTAGQRRAFLYEAMRGDGTTNGCWPSLGANPERNRDLFCGGPAWRLALSDKYQVDAVQHIAALLGIRTTVAARGSFHNVTIWQRSGNVDVAGLKRGTFVADGAWCPTTNTGFWVARRNGKVFITGNSHPAEAVCHAAPVLFPLGSLRPKPKIITPTHARYFGT